VLRPDGPGMRLVGLSAVEFHMGSSGLPEQHLHMDMGALYAWFYIFDGQFSCIGDTFVGRLACDRLIRNSKWHVSDAWKN
jgi:hypothetical protein